MVCAQAERSVMVASPCPLVLETCQRGGESAGSIPATGIQVFHRPADSNNMSTKINDWYPETKSLLDRLTAAGVTLVGGDNGEERFKFDGDLDKFIGNLTACDESRLFVRVGSRKRWLFLVYGNCPGELVNDYLIDESDNTLDKVTDAHYEEWSGKPQPTKVRQ